MPNQVDTPPMRHVEQRTLQSIQNTVDDLRQADYRTFPRHIKKLSRLLHSDELAAITERLSLKADLDAWIKAGAATQVGGAGSAYLEWPEDSEEELGLVIAMTDHFSNDEEGIWTPERFSHDFFFAGNITANLHHMVPQVFVPFARDFIDYVKRQTRVRDTAPTVRPVAPASRKIFVVHGHEEGAREGVARFLESLDLQPIILHEQASRGRTIIEKIEEHGDVGFAVVLLTPDDIGASRAMPDTLKPRARQNVLIELGYFVGRLGRSKVVALKRGEIEIPTDYYGVAYVDFDSGNGWKQGLGNELNAAGYEFDWNKIMVRR